MPAPFGNQLYYAGRDRKYFGVADNDPKAEKHFLMLSQTRFGNMADSNFGELQWKQYFLIAGKILQAMGVNNWPIRLVTNFGVGFQQGARVHMHVMARQSGFASIFPDQYGFAVRSDGTVMASQEREDLQMIVTLIDRRKELQGNSEAVQRSRAALDQRIFTALQQIAHS